MYDKRPYHRIDQLPPCATTQDKLNEKNMLYQPKDLPALAAVKTLVFEKGHVSACLGVRDPRSTNS
jgi:hypothetical protein